MICINYITNSISINYTIDYNFFFGLNNELINELFQCG